MEGAFCAVHASNPAVSRSSAPCLMLRSLEVTSWTRYSLNQGFGRSLHAMDPPDPGDGSPAPCSMHTRFAVTANLTGAMVEKHDVSRSDSSGDDSRVGGDTVQKATYQKLCTLRSWAFCSISDDNEPASTLMPSGVGSLNSSHS